MCSTPYSDNSFALFGHIVSICLSLFINKYLVAQNYYDKTCTDSTVLLKPRAERSTYVRKVTHRKCCMRAVNHTFFQRSSVSFHVSISSNYHLHRACVLVLLCLNNVIVRDKSLAIRYIYMYSRGNGLFNNNP